MNKFIAIAFLSLVSSLVQAKESGINLTCKMAGDTENSTYLRIVAKGNHIEELSVGIYTLIEKGKQIDDVGTHVFDVNIGKLKYTEQHIATLSVSLQDYSDIQGWDFTISTDSKEAAVVAFYRSSDGDDLKHIRSPELECK